MMAAPADAWIVSGRCEASANGQNLAVNSPENPLKVKEHGTVSILAKSTSPTGTLSYGLTYFEMRFASKTESFNQGLARTTVPVDRYATYGVGSYAVDVTVSGPEREICGGVLYLDVKGNPLSKTAGQAAAAGEAAGAVGLVGSIVAGTRARVPEGMEDAEGMTDSTAHELEKRSSEALREEKYGPAPTTEEVLIKWPWEVCGFFIFSAILMTLMVAAAGSSGRRVRVRWKPRLSVIGIGSGLLLGISTIVLLQQYGVLFPTRNIGIIGLVTGFLLGIILPTWARFRALKKAARRAW